MPLPTPDDNPKPETPVISDRDVSDPTIAAGMSSSKCTQLFSDQPSPVVLSALPSAQPDLLPNCFGRYRIVETLGKGSFGKVYRAIDDQLQRNVAVKVTNANFLSESMGEIFISEARILASLDHPGIVPVYDMGETDKGDFYIVSKLIEGSDLATRIKFDLPNRKLSLQIVESIANALHYAHARGLVHRDVKPGNILIDRNDRVFLADFGLAIRETDIASPFGRVGTPAYMSPEQARGEGNRVNNRSDIYSLGVVLYELLTGRRPFKSDDNVHLMELIGNEDVRSPRQFDESIPVDLERICLKALSRHSRDRFSVASDFAAEIRSLLTYEQPSSNLLYGSRSSSLKSSAELSKVSELIDQNINLGTHSPAIIVPKGLRSFDSTDTSFFLELLPGPFDRDGLPQSLRFWKTRIEEPSGDNTFNVGLIYGPSGCGKSSLVKAGLLPRLGQRIMPVYIEATPHDTESRLVRGVRRAIPEAEGSSLKELLSVIRRRRLVPDEGKVLLVIDQFEQWLYTETEYAKASLTKALRQCDGTNVQAVLLVRDDFWLSVSRFMQELEIPIREQENSAMVDLFNVDHASKVLRLFGSAFGKLPQNVQDLSKQQTDFLRKAIDGLAQDRKVISVRLAIFAEMMKSRDWTSESLDAVGGIEGVGVTFLEENFGTRYSPIQHRSHEKAVRSLLAALLPASGTDIKGVMRTAADLQSSAGYEQKPREFEDLITILDKSLRLISQVDESPPISDNSQVEANVNSVKNSIRYYQLTHDYLVPSLREWLTQKRRETREGRAFLKLEERAATWKGNREENKQLPSLPEWLTICRWTKSRDWSITQRAMMSRAGRFHGIRCSVGISILGVAVYFCWNLLRMTQVEGLVNNLRTVEPRGLPPLVRSIDASFDRARGYIRPLLDQPADSPDHKRERFHARLASVRQDPSLIEPIVEELFTLKDTYIQPVCEVLQPFSTQLSNYFQSVLNNTKNDPQHRFRAALILARLHPDSGSNVLREQDFSFIAEQLVAANPEYQPLFRHLLLPFKNRLLPELVKLFKDPNSNELVCSGVANAFADFDPQATTQLCELLTLASPQQFSVLFPLVDNSPDMSKIELLQKIALQPPSEQMGTVDRVGYGQQRANAAIALWRLGEREKTLPLFAVSDDPEALYQFVFRSHDRGLSADSILEMYRLISGNSMKLDKTSNQVQYALLLSLGEYSLDEIAAPSRNVILKELENVYRNHPSSTLHGVSGWLLNKWGKYEIVEAIDRTPVPYSSEREWFTLAIQVNTAQPDLQQNEVPSEIEAKEIFYYTFVVFSPTEFQFGALPDEPGKSKNETEEMRHPVRLTRSFAILNREVSMEELIAFSPLYSGIMRQMNATPKDAGGAVDWYDSVRFCRWLGEQMKLADEDQAYADPNKLDLARFPRDPQQPWAPKNWPIDVSKKGFRLPSEAEWEYAARGGFRTVFGFGSDNSLLPNFAWSLENSGKKVHTPCELRPGIRGLFDMHGNLFEWTHDWHENFTENLAIDPIGPQEGLDRVYRGGGWNMGYWRCRTANRDWYYPSYRNTGYGFRIALTITGISDGSGEKKGSSD